MFSNFLFVLFSLCSSFGCVESSKAYVVSPDFSADHYCGGNPTWHYRKAFTTTDAVASSNGCADAVAPDSDCSSLFVYMKHVTGGSHLCQCVRTDRTCIAVDDSEDPAYICTIYQLVTALYVAGHSSWAGDSSKPDSTMAGLLIGLGFSVYATSDDYVSTSSSSTFCGFDLIVVSSSVDSSYVGAKLNSCTSSIVTWGMGMYLHLGMTSVSESVSFETTNLIITQNASAHGDPLTGGLSGNVQVFSSNYKVPSAENSQPLTIGADSAQIIATVNGKAVIFYYNKGANLADGSVAAGMRIATIPYFNPSHSLPPLTSDGTKLIEASFLSGLPANCLGVSRCSTTAPPTTMASTTTVEPTTTMAATTTTPITTEAPTTSMAPTTTIAPSTTMVPTTNTASITTTAATLTTAPITTPMNIESVQSTATTTNNVTTSGRNIGKTFRGEMVLRVTNAAQLVQEPNVEWVMTLAVAELYNVSEAWIHNMSVSLRNVRRLSRWRRAVDSADVDVTWEIWVPPNADGGAVVTVFSDEFDAKTMREVTVTVNTFLNSGALEGQYTGDVQWVYVIPEDEEELTTPEENPRSEAASAVMVIVTVVGGCISLSGVAILLIIAWHRATSSRKYKRSEGNQLTDCGIGDLIKPPESITNEDAEALYLLCEQIANSYEANLRKTKHKVCVTYAAGQRNGDAEGVGPGSYYAAAVAKVLNYHGVPCLFDMLMMDVHDPRSFFTSQLTERADCRVLIAVQTKAFYHSQDCLKDIYVGQQSKLKLLPLRFEAHLPEVSETWPEITREDLEGMLMVSEVHHNFCRLNATPSPPWTVCNQPGALLETAHDLLRSLDIAADHEYHDLTPVQKLKELESLRLEASLQMDERTSFSSISTNALIHMESDGENNVEPFEDKSPFLESTILQTSSVESSEARASRGRRNKSTREVLTEGRSSSKRRTKSVDKDSTSKHSYSSEPSTRKPRRPIGVDGSQSEAQKVYQIDAPERKRSKEISKSQAARRQKAEASRPVKSSGMSGFRSTQSDQDFDEKKSDSSKATKTKNPSSNSPNVLASKKKMFNDGGRRNKSTAHLRV